MTNITLDRLRYFMEVSKLEHVGLASRSLGISASAISAAIASIEEECQCALFDRSNKRIHLNEKGKLFRERVEPILEQIAALTHQISSDQTIFRGFLSVGGSHFLAVHYLQNLLDEIQTKNADLRAENSPLRTTQVIQDVLDGFLDYGVCFSPHGHPQLEMTTLHTGTLKIAVSKNHPLAKAAKKDDFKLAQINRFPAFTHKFAPGIDYCENHPIFETVGIKPKISQYFHSDDLCVQSLIRSEAWAMIPDIVVKQYSRDLIALPLPRQWKAPYEICSIYRKALKDRPLLHFLDERLKKTLC